LPTGSGRPCFAGDPIKGITDEQTRAFAQATEASGLALIDGQGGSGKELRHCRRAAYEESLHDLLKTAR